MNAMKVAPSQQVMLRVRFLEVARSCEPRNRGELVWGKQRGEPRLHDRPGHVLRGGQTCYRPDARFAGLWDAALCRRERKSGTRTPVPPAAGHRAFRYSILWGLCCLHLWCGAAPFGVALASLATKGGSLDVTLSALETKGLIRRLAEPDLIALSGDTASFLAGGEFPVPVAQPGSTGGVPVITVRMQALRRSN